MPARDDLGRFVATTSEIIDAEVVGDEVQPIPHTTSQELAIRDPFKEWEIRLAQLRLEEEQRQAAARESELARFVASWDQKAWELALGSEALELSHHVDKLEAIGDWNQPGRRVSSVTFEIWWDFQVGRADVEWPLADLMEAQMDTVLR